MDADRGPGPALPPLKSLVSYSGGGTVVEIANGGATVRSPSHGSWKRIGNRTYGSTAVFFRYDPVSGAFIGTLKLRHELELAQDGQSFSGVAIGELRDANGNLLPGSNTRKDHRDRRADQRRAASRYPVRPDGEGSPGGGPSPPLWSKPRNYGMPAPKLRQLR